MGYPKANKPEEIKNNESDICKNCPYPKSCCNRSGCITHPYDLFRENEPTIDLLNSIMDTGNYTIDWYEGDPFITEDRVANTLDILEKFDRVYFIRMREYDDLDYMAYPSFGGRCIHIQPSTGCKFKWDEKPYGAKVLIPPKNRNDECKFYDFIESRGSESAYKQWFAIQWIPYQNLIIDYMRLPNKKCKTDNWYEGLDGFIPSILSLIDLYDDHD